MSTGSTFPTTLDTFVDKVDGIDDILAVETNTQSSAIEALEAKVGINNSAVATSLDYRINALEDNLDVAGIPDGYVLTVNAAVGDGYEWQASLAGGDTIAPATNTANYIPQWNGANTKTLKDGLAFSTSGTLTENSDTTIASQKATKTYADTLVSTSIANAIVPVDCVVRYDTVAGLGSTNTCIPYFTNKNTDTSSAQVTLSNSATNGLSITIVTPGLYFVSFWGGRNGGGSEIGISLNSNQLTTAVSSITASHRLAFSITSATNVVAFCSALVYCSLNDVIRPHVEAITPITTASTGFMLTKVSL